MTNAVNAAGRTSAPANSTTVNHARRTFLAGAAAMAANGAASAANAAVALTTSGGDPVFGAIERHKIARAGVIAAVDAHSVLEREIIDSGSRMSATREDDPRIEASDDAMSAAYDAETDAACDILNNMPTTPAGVLTLLAYAIAADPDGHSWPDALRSGENDDPDMSGRSWHQFLIANLADALPRLMKEAV